MKRLIFLLLASFISIPFNSCNDDELNEELYNQIIEKWDVLVYRNTSTVGETTWEETYSYKLKK